MNEICEGKKTTLGSRLGCFRVDVMVRELASTLTFVYCA
jgi:hypothetical protein